MKKGNFQMMKEINKNVANGEIVASFCNCSWIRNVHSTINRDDKSYVKLSNAKLVFEG